MYLTSSILLYQTNILVQTRYKDKQIYLKRSARLSTKIENFDEYYKRTDTAKKYCNFLWLIENGKSEQ